MSKKLYLNLPQHILELNPNLLDEIASIERTPDLAVGSPSGNGMYRSKLEERVARDWIPAQGWIFWSYEPKQFHLVGFKYTPDFIGVTEDLKIVAVEVKGEYRNRRASRMAWRSMAATYPSATFCWLEWKDGQWHENWMNATK